MTIETASVDHKFIREYLVNTCTHLHVAIGVDSEINFKAMYTIDVVIMNSVLGPL